MAIISPVLPTVGGARGDGELALRNDVDALLDEFNGNIDDANIKSGADIDGDKLAAGSVGSDRLVVPGVVAAGKSIVATTEPRTNTGYGLLTTPDRVQNIAVPGDALVFIQFAAIWQEAVAGAGRAAIFIGSNQFKAITYTGGGSPQPVNSVQEVGIGTASKDVPLATYGLGLASIQPSVAATDYAGNVTTGQAAGLVGTAGSIATAPTVYGGVCVVDNLAAATYDFSIQFKSTSGSVTVKSRRLRVWVMQF